MKYLSLNVWLGGKVWGPLIEFLKKEKPDILAIQEAQRAPGYALEPRFNTVYELARAVGYAHTAFAPLRLIHFSEKKHVQSGNAIFSNLPITHNEVRSFDLPYGEIDYDALQLIRDFSSVPFGFQHVSVNVGGVEINVFNVHGIWGKNGLDSPRRLAMAKVLIEAIKGKKNVIMSGDFNMDADSEVVREIEQHLTYVLKNKAKTTFNVKQKNDPKWGGFVVDLLFASPDLKIKNAAVLNNDVSDHLPLMMEFEL